MTDYGIGPRCGKSVVVLWDHGWANRICNHSVHGREAGVRDRLAIE